MHKQTKILSGVGLVCIGLSLLSVFIASGQYTPPAIAVWFSFMTIVTGFAGVGAVISGFFMYMNDQE